MQNIKIILDSIKQYLSDKKIETDNTIITAVKKRKMGKHFSMNEHIRGMFYALISGGAMWNVIKKNEKYIDETFFFFDQYKLLNQLKINHQYFYDMFKYNKCGIRFLEKSLNALYYNICIFKKVEKKYGSIENYINEKTPYEILENFTHGEYKLQQMRQTLVAEYMRNIGIDFSKPDSHVLRILGQNCLNYAKNNTPIEAIKLIEKFSYITNYSQTEIDFLLWHFCSESYGEICTKNNPKCKICPIKMYCKKGINIAIPTPKQPKIFIKKRPQIFTIESLAKNENRNSNIEIAYRSILCNFEIDHIYKHRQILDLVNSVYHNETSIIPSDYCYNRINLDIVDDFEKRMHIFIYVCRDTYKFIGENASYTGNIVHKDKIVGHWENGKITYLDKSKVR